MRRLLLALVALVSLFAAAEPLQAADAPDRGAGVSDLDRLLEFPEVPVDQVEHWVEWTLAQLEIEETEWGCPEPGALDDPHPHCQYVFWSYPAAWVRLTDAQYLEVTKLDYGTAMRSMTPRPMAVPELETLGLDSGFQHPGGNGREVVPPGLLRIGFNPFDLPEHSVKVGVLDTGVAHHDDLVLAGGADCTFGGHPDLYQHDVYGHGTHVAGTVAAQLNGSYVVGGNPRAQLYSIKVLADQGWGSDASVACGIDQAVMLGLDIVNLSLGGGGEPSDCDSWDISHNIFCAASRAGLVIVVAAGNDGVDAAYKSPANYGESVVTVSAIAAYDAEPGGRGSSPCNQLAADDELVYFSNIGSLVDFAAPGVCVQSTVPFNTDDWYSGTSMATPHVTAAISDYMARYPACAHIAVREVREWSQEQMAHDAFTGDWDAFPEPIVKYGAPECDVEERS